MRSGRNNTEHGGFHGRGGGGRGHGYHHKYNQPNGGSERRGAPQHSSPHHRVNRPPPPPHTWGYTPSMRSVGSTRGRAGDVLHAPPAQPSPDRGDHLTQVCGGACNKTWRAFCFPLPFPFDWRPRLFISCGYSLGD